MEDTGCAGSNSAKRNRDEPEATQQAKRIRAADLILLDILDDVEAMERATDANAEGDLASVMRSFEEEIAWSSPPRERPHQPASAATETPVSVSPSGADDRRDSDLGYLLEASDDELGLPPTVAPSSSDEREGADGDLVEDGSQGVVGTGQIWGLEDDIPSCYDELDFGVFGQDSSVGGGGDDDGAVYDGGLFDFGDVASFGLSDYSDFSRQPEWLPAV